MSEKFTITGIPDIPGTYESERFPLDRDLGHDDHYSAYYKYPDGTFWEGSRDDEEPLEIRPSEAWMYGPYRRVSGEV